MSTQAVIFDLGRVLVGVDTGRGLWDRILTAMGRENSETPRGKEWLSIYRRFATGRLAPREFHPQVCRLLQEDMSYEDFTTGWCDVFYTLKGARDFLGEVAERVPVGLLSDTDPLHWDFELRRNPWLGIFERPTLSFETGYMKPAPEAYLAAAANVGRDPGQCFFIDDMQENVTGARQAGMLADRFTTYDALRARLIELGILEPR